MRLECACHGSNPDVRCVHLSCLAEYAAFKSKQCGDGGKDVFHFVKPWQTCPSCLQYYQNKLAVDITTEFCNFVHKQVEALYVKLCALNSMLVRLTHVQKNEFDVIANDTLSLIDRMKGEVSPLPIRYSKS